MRFIIGRRFPTIIIWLVVLGFRYTYFIQKAFLFQQKECIIKYFKHAIKSCSRSYNYYK